MANPTRFHLVPLTSLFICFGFAGSVLADPVGLITLRSDEDAQTATALVGQAYARLGNQYVVAAGEAAQYRLEAEGLGWETLLDGANLDDVYQVYSMDHPDAPERVDLRQFGPSVQLRPDLRLAYLTVSAAQSLSETSHMFAGKLSERNIALVFRPPTYAAPLADDYPMDYLADLVELDSLYAVNQRLQDFQTRYAYTDSCVKARDWIVSKFEAWGYTEVNLQPFYYNGWHNNIEVIKRGTVEPNQYILIGGHYDSYTTQGQSPGPYLYAPGADDDGSGTALTMELARVLADVPTRKSIIFMPFAAEEVGLVGSWNAAEGYSGDGTKLEAMYNFDMVGYVDDAIWDIDLSAGDITAYRDLSVAVTSRVTSLVPVSVYAGTSSDHYPFDQEGFPIVNHIESDFNWDGWHTNLDLTSRMNFDYLTQVARQAIVSAATVAESPYPAAIATVDDVGDGGSLLINWSDCSSDCSYTIYWGSATGAYTDSAQVSAGQCSYLIPGLMAGESYFMMAIGTTPDGFRAIYGTEGNGVPYLYPRPPAGISAEALGSQLALEIDWEPNRELDLSHYDLYRRASSIGAFNLYQSGLTQTSFLDVGVAAHVEYSYRVVAVDESGLESDASDIVSLFPASFDGGLVVGDAFTKVNDSEPEQPEQEAWMDTILSGRGFALAHADENGGPVKLSDIGQYATLIWMDEDIVVKDIASSAAALEEFANHPTNMAIVGWKTWFDWAAKVVPSNHLLNDEFGLANYDYLGVWDWAGGFGQNGWPSVEVDPARGPDQWRDIAILTPRAGAQIIYTYDSNSDRVGWEGEPVGLAYTSPNGKRVLLSFPLYYLSTSSAQAVVDKIFEFFGTGPAPEKGDIDMSGTIDIGDIAVLIDHLFINFMTLSDESLADVDGVTGLSLGDVYYLINYLFVGGPAPVPDQN